VIRHALTHRRYEFDAYEAELVGKRPGGVWIRLADLDRYPFSKPQLSIAALLAGGQA